MKKPATIRKEHERYADKRNLDESNALFSDIRTNAALLKQAQAVIFFLREDISETAPFLAERELIRLVADVALRVKKHG